MYVLCCNIYVERNTYSTQLSIVESAHFLSHSFPISFVHAITMLQDAYFNLVGENVRFLIAFSNTSDQPWLLTELSFSVGVKV